MVLLFWKFSANYAVNRYYDPTTGMFFTVDPDLNETGQPYAFAGDDPVDQNDPLGLCNSGVANGYYPGACATTAAQSLAAAAYIESHVPSAGFSFSKGLDAVGHVAESAYDHPGTTLELAAAGVCIVATVTACAVAVVVGTGAEVYQGGLNASNVSGSLLLGATDLLTAGIGGIAENIASEATEGFTETVLYKGVNYTLRVLSVSPSVVIQLSNALESGASTTANCT